MHQHKRKRAKPAKIIHEPSLESNQANKIPTAAASFLEKKIIPHLSFIWLVLRACSFCFRVPGCARAGSAN
jgi:hypothetical protein